MHEHMNIHAWCNHPNQPIILKWKYIMYYLFEGVSGPAGLTPVIRKERARRHPNPRFRVLVVPAPDFARIRREAGHRMSHPDHPQTSPIQGVETRPTRSFSPQSSTPRGRSCGARFQFQFSVVGFSCLVLSVSCQLSVSVSFSSLRFKFLVLVFSLQRSAFSSSL